LGGRHHLHSDEPWLYVSCGRHGLVQPQNFILAGIQYPDTDFCTEAVEEAISRYGAPEIFNTDQGAQFTSAGFTKLLKSHNVGISMDGRGRVQDNIFIERLWWTLKYQYLYLWSFNNGTELRSGLKQWFGFYNAERSHQALDNLTPDEVYFALLHPFAEAA
jgi:putative transposase